MIKSCQKYDDSYLKQDQGSKTPSASVFTAQNLTVNVYKIFELNS